MIIGVTGCTGSGKSTLVTYLSEHFNFRTIDLDLVGHEVLNQRSVKVALVSFFGSEVMQDSGDIDRAVLGQLVFSSSDALSQLNQLVHPKIKVSVLETVASIKPMENAVIVGALINEIGLTKVCDHILFIDVDREQILNRMPQKEAIIRHQSEANSYRLEATSVIRNDFSDRFFQDGMQVFEKLLR